MPQLFQNGPFLQNVPSGTCKKCSKKHNTLLHLGATTHQSPDVRTGSQPTPKESKCDAPNTVVTSAAAESLSPRWNYVLLATARVVIIAANGNSAEFQAILDSESQVNFVSERLVQRIRLSTYESSLCINGVGNGKRHSSKRVNVKLQSRSTNFATNRKGWTFSLERNVTLVSYRTAKKDFPINFQSY